MSVQPPDAAGSNIHVRQSATAAESAIVIQVGGDLYLSDAGLASYWAPPPTTPGECPYPGLDAFGPGQARWFYGRENVTGDLLRYLDEMTPGGPGGPLLVVAPSGTGKSSLLGAGLMTALAEGRLPARGSASWPRVMITPGPHPLDTLRAALATVDSTQAPARDGGASAGGDRVILVIDQLEEIFTVCESEAERSGFLNEVGTLAADAGPGSALVVLGMRADFYARATGYPVLRQAMQARQVVLGAMTPTEVRQAIVRPARLTGLTLEAGLTERLLRDLGVSEEAGAGGTAYEPGRLPLLAHALRATWQRRDGSQLTIAGYEAAGGLAGAIARTAEAVYAQLDPPTQVAARQVFLGLVRVGSATGDGAEATDTRRRVAAEGLLSQAADPVAARRALEAFTAARLLTSGGQAVEITHEALLRRWPRLRSWIDEDRSGLLVRQELEDAATAWAREGRDASALYGGVRLAAAQAWATAPARARELSQAGRDFLTASERRRRRGTRRRNGVIAVLAALSLVLAGLSLVALNERATAQSNFGLAEAGLLAAESSQATSDLRPDTGLQFAAEAYHLDPSSPQVRDAVLGTQALPITGRLLVNGAPDTGNETALAYNPAGTLIAGGDGDGTVHLWSASTYRLLWSHHYLYRGTSVSQVNAVAFSPDRRTLAVSQPGVVWLWNIANPADPVPAGQLTVPSIPGFASSQVTSFAFSPNGRVAAAGLSTGQGTSVTGVVVLWNTATRAPAGVIPESFVPDAVVFTPDGKSLALDTTNGGVELWNVARRTLTAQLQAPSGTTVGAAPYGLAVSPNGQFIAYPVELKENSFTVRLWSVAARRVTATVPAGSGGISSIAFSPDSAQLAIGGLYGAVQLWDARTDGQLATFAGHRLQVTKLAFSPDGKRLASASNDGTIDLWDTQGVTLGGANNPSLSLAVSPDGRTLALSTLSQGGLPSVALYALPARTLIALLPVGALVEVAFSRDGKTLATMAAGTGIVELWNVSTGRLTGTFQTGLQISGVGTNIAFSPDGTLLVVSGLHAPVMQVWSVARLALAATVSVTQGTTSPRLPGVAAMAFSGDGRLLALGGADGGIRVYSVPGFRWLDTVQGPGVANSLAFSPDERDLASANGDGNVDLYSLPATGSLNGNISEAGALAASSRPIQAVQFTSDDSLVAAGGDGVVRFWTVPTGPALAASKTLYTATTPAQSIATHGATIWSAAYSAPLGLIATATGPSGSRVWQANPATVAAGLCQTLLAPVQPSLWKEYLPTLPYKPVCG